MTLRQAAFRAAAVASIEDAPQGRASIQTHMAVIGDSYAAGAGYGQRGNRGSVFVDQPNLIGRDGVRPTNAGHSYMAQRIAPLIYDQLTIRI
jgi:hypothetical protein